jgi:protein disulfide-isomerase A4
LVSSNFTRWAQNRQLSLVNFYINDSKTCKKLEPEFEQAFKYLEKNEKPIYLAQVNCDKENELCSKYQIMAYPTLIIFREGRPFDYNGGNNASEIIEFMLKSQKPASIEVHSFANFKTYIKNPIDNYVIGIFNDKTHSLFDSYMKFTSRYPEDLKMFHTFEYEDFLKHISVNITIPAIVAYFPDVILTKNEPNGIAFTKVSD